MHGKKRAVKTSIDGGGGRPAEAERPTEAGRPVLRLDGITKRYPRGAQDAVSGLSLDVYSGEVVALVGESGSGKTTALRLIAGFETPDSGTVELSGRVVAADPPEKRGVGVVFQDQALFPHLTVFENVAFGLHGSRSTRGTGGLGFAGYRGAAQIRRRVEEVLDLTGTSGLAARYPHELSGGQVQRIAVARALAPQPTLILLDEPFNNLDAPLKRRLSQELRQILRAAGTSAVLVTHDPDEAFALASRVVFLKDGREIQRGTPRELFEIPARAEVATFFGPVNVIPAVPARDGYETALGLIGQARSSPSLTAVPPGEDVMDMRRGCELLIRPDSFTLEGADYSGTDAPSVAVSRVAAPAGLLRIRGRVWEVIFRGDFYEVLVVPEVCSYHIRAPHILEVHMPRLSGTDAPPPQADEAVTLSLRRIPVCAACRALPFVDSVAGKVF
ncbi:MAG: ATP-binding cassette domain-containing protein [Spirochaetes bacterium]|jgi:iron(III) transport system ATP-binding protein|nr:ATP-binding cassette domain-containing protein [Spirochaetota bacterium]